MTKHTYDWFVRVFAPLALLAGAGAVIAWFAAERAMDPGPPIMVRAAQALAPTVRPGEEIKIRFTIDRNRACPAQIVGFMVDKATNEAVIRFEPILGGYSQVGSGQTVLLSRPTPTKAGHYCYRAIVTHVCASGVYETTQPDACFEVTP